MKPAWLNRCLVEAPFYFTLATDEDTFLAALKHLRVPKAEYPEFVLRPSANATTHWFERKTGEGTGLSAVVTIKYHEDDAQVKALLAHEAVHLWQMARERLGETNPSSEFEAYAIQALSLRLFDEYERQTKEKP